MRRQLKPASVDGVIHSALRGMLCDAKAAGYRVVADELDNVISAAAGSRNPPGTLPSGGGDNEHRPDAEPVRDPTVGQRAGDRGRTGDVQLGKQRRRSGATS